MLHRLYYTRQDSYHQEHDIHAGRHFLLLCACHQASRPERLLLVTSLAHTEMNVVEDIRKEGIEVKALPSARSVCFENIYGKTRTNVRNASRQRPTRLQWKACRTSMRGLSTWAACWPTTFHWTLSNTCRAKACFR